MPDNDSFAIKVIHQRHTKSGKLLTDVKATSRPSKGIRLGGVPLGRAHAAQPRLTRPEIALGGTRLWALFMDLFSLPNRSWLLVNHQTITRPWAAHCRARPGRSIWATCGTAPIRRGSTPGTVIVYMICHLQIIDTTRYSGYLAFNCSPRAFRGGAHAAFPTLGFARRFQPPCPASPPPSVSSEYS